MKKRQTRRSRNKYPALHPNLNLKTRYDELTDFDYIDKLNDKEKQWMNNFLEEYVNANLKHSGKVLHKTKKHKKSCYDRNNSRNRDLFGKARVGGRLTGLDTAHNVPSSIEEDKLIALIDLKNERKKTSK